MKSIYFNAHHSPIGAFASFTLGFPGAKGGLGLELGGPADQNVYIGLQSGDCPRFDMLPFCDLAVADNEAARYDFEQADHGIVEAQSVKIAPVKHFAKECISREFRVAKDTWRAGDLTFTIFSPVMGAPDPEAASDDDLRFAFLPAVIAELTVDNTAGSSARRAVFGYTGSDPYSGMRRLEDTTDGKLIGVAQGRSTAIAAVGEGIRAALGFGIDNILSAPSGENFAFGLGNCGVLLMDTPAGERRTFRVAIAFYRGGIATSGIDATYLYTRLFGNIEEVCQYALDHFGALKDSAHRANDRLDMSGLSGDQQFMLAHAIRSYYGSTQLLEHDGALVWVVNEGEYRMMNTFDLTVDQMFYELNMNPWTVRNELDLFAARYSYQDEVREPGSNDLCPGGISFTHDMGVSNVFSRPRYSSYEQSGLRGCFSYMTQEQLANWVVTAGAYIERTHDMRWRDARMVVFAQCLQSLVNRDHFDPSRRDGIMSLDSSRTAGGSEITTYDSLDESLGQARNNIYLAVKCWAAYVILERLMREGGFKDDAALAAEQARLCARTLVGSVTEDGWIPAVLENGNTSRIIPAVEGLVYPHLCGCNEALDFDGPYSELLHALKRHLEGVLASGACLFEEGGWKLSSTSNNSWLSKIYLCQFVARRILRVGGKHVAETPDGVHAGWLLDERNSYYAWSDQILSGRAVGSRYYPRGVTAILWLDEHRKA